MLSNAVIKVYFCNPECCKIHLQPLVTPVSWAVRVELLEESVDAALPDGHDTDNTVKHSNSVRSSCLS
jgi:hypothetical protein